MPKNPKATTPQAMAKATPITSKSAPGSALTPVARTAVEGFINALQRNPAAALVALAALALAVLLIFG